MTKMQKLFYPVEMFLLVNIVCLLDALDNCLSSRFLSILQIFRTIFRLSLKVVVFTSYTLAQGLFCCTAMNVVVIA